jgi:uncharacterized protein YoaH (UPF0181 family)
VSFADFMAAQVAEIEASGMDAEEWIEQHAEEFRAAHPVDETTPA